jgi:glycosyltransferase involved in cell wall biosynthesis
MADGVIAEGVPLERVHVVPNSSDLDIFSPGPKDTNLVKRFGLNGRFVVGYAGALGPSNAVEDSVPAAARLLRARKRSDIVFLIAGDGRCLPGLRATVERDGLDNVVLAGTVPKREVPRITATSDVLLTLFADRPILATNSPNKFFDGLASGRPMIVNSPGWTRELVEENECGLYVPAGDPAALADAIETLADDPAMRAQMGENARALAEREFSRDLLAHRLIVLLEETARTRRSGGRTTTR